MTDTKKDGWNYRGEEFGVRVRRELRYILVLDDLCAFKLTHTYILPDYTPKSIKALFGHSNQQGLARLGDIERYLSDATASITCEYGPVVVPVGFSETAKEVGYLEGILGYGDPAATSSSSPYDYCTQTGAEYELFDWVKQEQIVIPKD